MRDAGPLLHLVWLSVEDGVHGDVNVSHDGPCAYLPAFYLHDNVEDRRAGTLRLDLSVGVSVGRYANVIAVLHARLRPRLRDRETFPPKLEAQPTLAPAHT